MWEAHHVHPCTTSNMSWSSHQSLPWQKPMMENSIENSRSLPDSAKKYRTHKGTVQALQVNLGFGKLGLVSIQYHPISSNIIQYHPIIQQYHPISSNRQSNHLVMDRIDTEAIHCLVEGLLLPFTWQILASRGELDQDATRWHNLAPHILEALR